jgi:hypothetical protein
MEFEGLNDKICSHVVARQKLFGAFSRENVVVAFQCGGKVSVLSIR